MVNNTTTDWPFIDYFDTQLNSTYDPAFLLKHGTLTTTILCMAYSTVFILGLVGNGFVVAVVARSPRMRSPTNLFIVNLACADLLVNVLCLPFTLIANLIPAWILGAAICKGVAYFQGVSVSASVNTLMAISLERCKAISTPLSGSMTSRSCRLVVTLIWVFALSINLPWIVVFTLEPIGITGSKAQICTELWPSQESENLYFVIANLIVCYLLPLAVISACYIQIWRRVALRRMPGEVCGQIMINRSKVKVLKMLFVVVVTFALSWLPLYVVFCIIKFGLSLEFDSSDIIMTLIPVAQWLGASNSCINPIIYAFFNRKFRAGFKAIITSKSCCGPLRYEKNNSCYYSYRADDARLRSVNMSAIKRERFTTQRHFSAQNIESQKNKTDLGRSKSVTVHNRDNFVIRRRRESMALAEGVDMPLKMVSVHKNDIKYNGATRV